MTLSNGGHYECPLHTMHSIATEAWGHERVLRATAPVHQTQRRLSMASVTSTADQIRAIERERLRALVDVDLEVAERLHADDFQLINPGGGSRRQSTSAALRRATYIIESGNPTRTLMSVCSTKSPSFAIARACTCRWTARRGRSSTIGTPIRMNNVTVAGRLSGRTRPRSKHREHRRVGMFQSLSLGVHG